MRVQHLSVQGCNEWNEDALIVNEAQRIYGVLDGATSPTGDASRETGGYLASHLAMDYFNGLNDNSREVSLREAVLEANSLIRARMAEESVDLNDKSMLWSSGIAVVRIGEFQIEYAQTGDCMIIAIYNDGTVRTVTHDQVNHFDEQTRQLWERCIAQGMSYSEAHTEIFKVISQNRQHTNTERGYAILNGEPELKHYVEHGWINRIQLQSLLIITDGLFLPRKAGEEAPTMADMVGLIKDMGLQQYVDWLIKNEYDESQSEAFTRLKVSDDKTAVLIDFK